MTDDADRQTIRVTAEQRLHPAIQKLARACIALARWIQERERAALKDESTSDAHLEQTTSAGGAAVDRGRADD